MLSHGGETWPGNELKLISRNRGEGASINFEEALDSTRVALVNSAACTMQWPQTGELISGQDRFLELSSCFIYIRRAYWIFRSSNWSSSLIKFDSIYIYI